MTIVFSLLISLIGLLMYVLAGNPKVVEIGRIMFWTGLLAFLLGGGLAGIVHVFPQNAH
jgi:hypothetical protein